MRSLFKFFSILTAIFAMGCGGDTAATAAKTTLKSLDVRVTVVGAKPHSAVIVIEFNRPVVSFTAETMDQKFVKKDMKTGATIYTWPITGLTSDATDAITVFAMSEDGVTGEGWAPLTTPPETPPSPPTDPGLAFTDITVQALTSKIGKITYATNKPAMVQVFTIGSDNRQYEVQPYGSGLTQEGPGIFSKMFWIDNSMMDVTKIAAIAYTDDGEVVRRADLSFDNPPSELQTWIDSLTATTATITWKSMRRNQSMYDSVGISCWQPSWHSDTSYTQIGDTDIGTVTITELQPGQAYTCQAQGSLHGSGLPVQSDNFTLSTPLN